MPFGLVLAFISTVGLFIALKGSTTAQVLKGIAILHLVLILIIASIAYQLGAIVDP